MLDIGRKPPHSLCAFVCLDVCVPTRQNFPPQTVSREQATTERAKVFQDLGWDHLVEGDKKWAVLGHPKSFALF